ncbi:MAG: PQQ-dependent sugar dehydrogenase [Ignavibacteria bacterium]|nr:PQQ-dependent sugar dehydrogenase [Ignavibacteria bacterium]
MKKSLTALILLFVNISIFCQAYNTDTLITGLPKPVSFAFMPVNKLIISIKDSTVRVYNNNGTFVKTFWNFKDSLYTAGQESGVLGVCVDPNFNSNHYVYVYYTHLTPSSIRVVRFTENNNSGTNPVTILNILQAQSGIHYGGNMHFGADGKLYISVGTGANNSDAQLLNSPRGKLLRINNDGTIPNNNPFYDDGNPLTGRDDRIWVRGLRNSFDFCFNPFNDSLYATENGNSIDEINFIRKGKNYGWPVCEGYCSPYIDSLKQPMFASNGYVPTGIIVYSGTQFPSLSGKIIFGSYNYQTLYIAGLNAALDSIQNVTAWAVTGRAVSISQGSDGNIYVLKYGFTNDGAFLRIKPFETGLTLNQEPVSFHLSQNYPNPFNPATNIQYEIPKSGYVSLKVYDAVGNEVSKLAGETKSPGSYEVTWDASNFPSGVYFCELRAGEYSERKKMVLVK